jgi:serine/threonine protein kinase
MASSMETQQQQQQQQSVVLAPLVGGSTATPSMLAAGDLSAGTITGVTASPLLPHSKPPITKRIRPGILSRQASEREEGGDSSSHLQSASEDDDARQSDSGSLPQRFPTEPNSAASSLRHPRSAMAPSPLNANFGSGSYAPRSLYSGQGGEASASSSRSHLPLQSRTSLYSRQASNDGTRGGDWSEDGAPGRASGSRGSESLSRAKSVSSVSSVNSTSSMEAVPFRAAPLGNVRVGYTGYAGRRNGAGRGRSGAPEGLLHDASITSAAPVLETSATSSPEASASVSPSNAGKHRILPKDPHDEWLYRNPPGMGNRSGARNALNNYNTIAVPRNANHSSSSSIAGDDEDAPEMATSPTSTLQAGQTKPSIRSKLAKRAGKLGLKPLTAVAASDYSSPPKVQVLLQSLDQIVPSQVVETRDPNNGSPAGSMVLPAISLSSAAKLSPDASSRTTKSYFSSSSFPGSSLTGISTDGDARIKTSSVTYAPLVVPKHPPGPPGAGPPPSPGLTGAPSPYHPFALASPLVSPQRMNDDVDPLGTEPDAKGDNSSAKTRSYDVEPKKPKRGSVNGLLNSAQLADLNQRHSLPAPLRASSPRRPATSPSSSSITPAQQIQKDVQAGIARAPAEPSGSNPGSGSTSLAEVSAQKEFVGIATATRLHAHSTRVESDFLFGDILGEGSYSTVLEAWDLKPLREKGIVISNGKSSSNLMGAMVGKKITAKQRAEVECAKVYAIKVLDKMHILKEKKQNYVGVEREALSLLIRHPGVITLYWTFHDRDNLYFIMELAKNGELLSFIKKLGSFNTVCTRYYAAQLVETIEAIHKAGVLHRDLKPENILLDADMRIKLADFGSAKLFKKDEKLPAAGSDEASSSSQSERARTSSFVGTAEYVSPELLTEKQVSESSDWWSFGCLLFQMLCGRPPFKGASEYQTFQKIMKREFEYPSGLSADAVSLLDGILVLDADQRLKYKDIKAHAFFDGFDWTSVWKCKAPELKVGLYQRPAPSAASMAPAPKWEDESDSLLSRDTKEASMSEDGSKSGARSVQESMNSLMLSDEPPLAQITKDEGEVQDADDDDSSFSESNSPAAPRRRGLSVGASAVERRLSLGSSNGKRAGDFFRMAAAVISSTDSKYESNKSPSSVLSAADANKTIRNGNTHNRTASTSMQAQASLATSWAALLLPNESLLYSCPILHKTTGALLRSGNKKRQLLLTDFPRLLCVKETNNQLRVKSEVILGLPQLASMPLLHQPWNAEDEDDDDDEDDAMQQRLAYTASQMRRQSSAGPLLASPSRSHFASTPATSGDSSSNGHFRMPGMERRESYPISRQQSFPTQGTTISSFGTNTNNIININTKNSSITSQSNNINNLNNTMNRLPGLTSSVMASTMDTSPNFMTSIEQKSTRTFIVTTPAKTFYYEDVGGDSSHLVKSILLAANRSQATSS